MTGTPVQNSPSDLQSILRFIKAYPYCDKHKFEYDINHKLKSGDVEEGIDRLKRLLSFLMLRRSLDNVLPPRNDFIQTLKFGLQEAEAYRQAAEMTLVSINDVLQSSHEPQGYLNALQKINSLRRICNVGHLSFGAESELLKHGDCSEEEVSWDEAAAQRALDRFHSLGLDLNCLGCRQPMNELPSLCHLTQCHHLWCAECFGSPKHGTRPCYCEPLCPSIKLHISSPKRVGASQSVGKREEFPTKVKALIADLQQQPNGNKRYVSHKVPL